MKIKSYILAAALSCPMLCAAQQINPITQAMLDGYAELLQANPNDYLTLYERASQYYNISDYESALSDIQRAIACTPAKEKDQLASEYALAADVYTEMKQYTDAYTAINKALELRPDTFKWIYTKGNLCLHLNDLNAAEQSYKTMQRMYPRSVEALFGLAKVAIAENRFSDAKELMKEVQRLDSNNYLTFCRLGDLHRDMNEAQEAAAEYLNAFSLATNSNRPMASLMELATTDYDALQQAIDYALDRTKNVVPLYFISGNAAVAAGKYGDAYTTYRQLLSMPDIDADALYPAMGEICLMRGDLDEADNYLSKALMLQDNEHNNLLKAKAENARGNPASALIYAENVLRKNPDNTDALLEAADAKLTAGDDAAALDYLNKAVISNAEDARPLLVRGFLQANGRAGVTSVNDFKRAASYPAANDEQTVYKAVAQALSGNILDANATISSLKERAEKNAGAAYLYALYLNNTGNLSEAQAMLNKAEAGGFENEYLLKYFKMPVISVNYKR